MKRLFFLIALAFFAILFTTKINVSHAQDTVVQTDTPVGIDTEATQSSVTTPTHINYELPYPGILPDNPFYFLKVIRDGIVKFLINDSLKKAQFSLLSAEKRMFAAKLLVDKGEDKLAVTTMGKSNNYLDDAITAIRAEKKENPKTPDVKLFLEQFKSATKKHHELADDMKPSIDKKYINIFVREEQRIIFSEKTAENLLRQR